MALLLDIDGTLLEGARPLEGAVEAVETLRARSVPLLFATNTSRKSRADVAASLRNAGLRAEEHEILSASYAAAEHLRAQGIRRVQLLLTPAAAADFSDLEITEENPQAVVVGDMGAEFTFEALNRAFRNLRRGARLVAAQKNRCWKSKAGWSLDAGAFVAALEYGADLRAEVIGKPSPGFFRMASLLLRCPLGSLTMAGDDLDADIAGARACGMRAVLVRSGNFDAKRLAAASPERSPHHVLESIRELPDYLAQLGAPGLAPANPAPLPKLRSKENPS